MTLPIEDYYSGDDAWLRFVNAHCESPMSGERYDPLIDQPIAGTSTDVVDLLVVAVSYFGRQHMKDWLTTPIDELEGKAPISCLEDTSLQRRLRTYMMQLPC
jgi:hypothetical protein